MILIGSALFDPASEESDIGYGQVALFGFGRRHDVVALIVADADKEFAVVRFPGNDGEEAVVIRGLN